MTIFPNKSSTVVGNGRLKITKCLCVRIYTYVPVPTSIYKDRVKNICKYFSLLQIKQERGKVYLEAIEKEIPSPQAKCSREKYETTHPNRNPHPIGMQGIFRQLLLGGFPYSIQVLQWSRGPMPCQ